MMLKLLLASALAATPGLSETLLSGAIFFDSENTLLEVQDLIKMGNQEDLARLFKANHISERVPANMDIVVLLSGLTPESKTEFHFINNPTTYWTFSKNVKTDPLTAMPAPSLSPAPNSTLPADLPSSLISSSMHLPAASTLTPTSSDPTFSDPTPIPRPKLVAKQEHRRAKEHFHPKDSRSKVISFFSRIFGPQKVWHKVKGRWKYYYVTRPNHALYSGR